MGQGKDDRASICVVRLIINGWVTRLIAAADRKTDSHGGLLLSSRAVENLMAAIEEQIQRNVPTQKRYSSSWMPLYHA